MCTFSHGAIEEAKVTTKLKVEGARTNTPHPKPTPISSTQLPTLYLPGIDPHGVGVYGST